MTMEEVGKVVSRIPPRRSGVGNTIDWEHYAHLARKRPGQNILVATHVRESLIKSQRLKKHPPFADTTGRIVVSQRRGGREGGVLYSDLYFTWEPKEMEQSA